MLYDNILEIGAFDIGSSQISMLQVTALEITVLADDGHKLKWSLESHGVKECFN